jgi:hypothetical protein
MDFHEIWHWGVVLKCVDASQFWLKLENNNGHCMKTYTHF